jgi:pimeloyl-ACP methyl ester carboxylesterase
MYETYSSDVLLELHQGAVRCVEHGPDRPEGAAAAPVLLFVHGFLVDGGVWGEVPRRLAALGYRSVVPTLPLGAHRSPMRPDAELSPNAVARLLLDVAESLDLSGITLVGNDTGGAICQLALATDRRRVDRLVLTNCDAFEVFPPRPFDLLFRAGRHPGLLAPVMQSTRFGPVRTGPLGFGLLTRRRLTAEETRPWVESYCRDPAVRRDVATFLRNWAPRSLVAASESLRDFDGPALIAWAPEDRFFRIELGRRLLATLPDAELVEVPEARTFVALDQPARLTELIDAFVRR